MMVAYAPVIRNVQPKVSNSGDCVIVKKTELIGPLVSTSTAFTQLMRLRCNPASIATFNWLSRMAPLFEFYKFRKLQFRVVTRSPTTAAGSIIMSPDYDAADGELAITEQSLFNNKGSKEGPVWEKTIVLSLDPASMNRLYKSHINMSDQRFGTTTQDEKTIDCAQVFICCDGAAAGSLGKLIVEYEVEFHNPQNPSELPDQSGVQMDTFSTVNGAPTTPFAGSVPVLQNVLNNEVLRNVATVSNTATVGQFIKDYQGIGTARISGTGLTGLGVFEVGDLPGAADQVGDIVQEALSKMTSGGTSTQTVAANIVARAGQYLKVKGPVNTTISEVTAALGGVQRLSALL
jgi:hypothetical protein